MHWKYGLRMYTNYDVLTICITFLKKLVLYMLFKFLFTNVKLYIIKLSYRMSWKDIKFIAAADPVRTLVSLKPHFLKHAWITIQRELWNCSYFKKAFSKWHFIPD